MRWRAAIAVVSLLALGGCATVPRKGPAERPLAQTGVASYYAKGLDGRPTASGERYDSRALTAAHRTLPFGSRVRVTNLDNGRSVVVRINDRGPHVESRVIDLSYAAARELHFIERGTARVSLEVLEHR
jgi:rare lipoprotein A